MPGFHVYMFGSSPFPVPAAKVEWGMSCKPFKKSTDRICASSFCSRLSRPFTLSQWDATINWDTFGYLIFCSILHQFLWNTFQDVVQAHIYHSTKFGCNQGNIDNAVEFKNGLFFGSSRNTVTPLIDTPIILVFLHEKLFKYSETCHSYKIVFISDFHVVFVVKGSA